MKFYFYSVLFFFIFLLFIGFISYCIVNIYKKKSTQNQLSNSEYGRLKQLNSKIFWSGFGFADKGETGENITERILLQLQIPKAILRNAYIPYKNKTSEIDILMITEYGIFVFESKNYSGWIFGSEHAAKWTQSLNKRNKAKFYNPILQNRTHIKALSNYLGLSADMFISYIVFSDRCELKKVPDNCNDFIITKRNCIQSYLQRDFKSRDVIISELKIEEFYNTLYPLTQVTTEQKIEHINNIHKQ